jgi:hypothetical protein
VTINNNKATEVDGINQEDIKNAKQQGLGLVD